MSGRGGAQANEPSFHAGNRPPDYRTATDAQLWMLMLNNGGRRAVVRVDLPTSSRGSRGHVTGPSPRVGTIVADVVAVPGVTFVDFAQLQNAEQQKENPDTAEHVIISLEITDLAALSALRSVPSVAYVEPAEFTVMPGCDWPAYEGNDDDSLFTPRLGVQPPNKVSWSFAHMGIQDAWELFGDSTKTIVDPGGGVTIAFLDTGISAEQSRLGSLFPLPYGERTITKVMDGDVSCSHGTRVAGLAGAPADGTAGSTENYVGVAWGANLFTIRVGDGVVQTVFNEALVVAGLRAAVAAGANVVNMAFGFPWESLWVRDTIIELYEANPRLLFVAAAGTNIDWVVFPASMDREVLGVSLVDFQPDKDSIYRLLRAPDYGLLDLVAYGSAVDFVAVSGPTGTPTTGETDSSVTTIGGSSAATAVISGILALIWSRLPGLTRDEVVARLANSASLAKIESAVGHYGRSGLVGYGIPDAFVAAGGARRAWITGPRWRDHGAEYELIAHIDGHESLYTLEWDSGEEGRHATFAAHEFGSRRHTFTATNTHNGQSVSVSIKVSYTGRPSGFVTGVHFGRRKKSRITSRLRGVKADGSEWEAPIEDVIYWIEAGLQMRISDADGPRIIVASLRGTTYLRAAPDRTSRNNLGALPRYFLPS